MTSFAYQSDTHFLKVGGAIPASPYALAGIAWDGATTNRPGARFGRLPRSPRSSPPL